jgi:hypothetical protein
VGIALGCFTETIRAGGLRDGALAAAGSRMISSLAGLLQIAVGNRLYLAGRCGKFRLYEGSRGSLAGEIGSKRAENQAPECPQLARR